jgi:ATP-dependent DNA helicase RecG
MGDVSPANLDWDRLQKALTVEAERGFNDLEGRQQRFSQFLYDRLNQPPAPLAAAERARWRSLAERYETYPDLGFAARQHLVAETRRTLYDSRRQWEQQTQPAASPSSRPTAAGAAQRSSVVRNRASHSPQNTIKAGQAPPSANNGNPPELDQPITYLKGHRPQERGAAGKTGAFSPSLDLLHYYPRDYINYAQQVAIRELQPGETVTLVGTVTRSTCFSSPKNPNLTIQELVLKDGDRADSASPSFGPASGFAMWGGSRGKSGSIPPGRSSRRRDW